MNLFSALALGVLVQTPQQQGQGQVQVQPASVEVGVDARARLDVVVTRDGETVENAVLRWISANPDVAAVDAQGVVSGLRPGEARVYAVLGNEAAGFADVRVPQLPPADITMSLPAPTVPAGASMPLEVVVRTRLGDALDPSRLEYESTAPQIASVDVTGRVFGLRAGRAIVRARAGDAVQELPVHVTPAAAVAYTLDPAHPEVRTGDVVHFRMRAVAPDGEAGDVMFPAWSVSGAGAEVTAEAGDGVFVAEQPGTYVVTALLGPAHVQRTTVRVVPRDDAARLTVVGRGPISTHHSGDTWVFEGVDGRDYAIIGTFMHDWVKVWDVTDPAAPVLTDSVQVDARRINDVKVHPNGRIAVITREGASDRRNGIVLLDLSDPAHPTVLSEYEETVTGGVHNTWIRGDLDLVYAVHNGTSDLHIIDISDPRSPREVGRWGLDKPVKTLHDVIVQDGYAYLSYWDDGLVILDAGAGTHGGTPTAPAFVSRFSYPEGNTHVAWRYGDYVFVGDEIFPDQWDPQRPIDARGYIHVLDVSDLENPREVARYEVPEAGAHNVWVEDDRLYVGYYQAGLRVVDVSGELRGDLYAQGREIAAMRTQAADAMVPNWSMTWGAQIFKGNIFTADMNSGLWVAKLEPERPAT